VRRSRTPVLAAACALAVVLAACGGDDADTASETTAATTAAPTSAASTTTAAPTTAAPTTAAATTAAPTTAATTLAAPDELGPYAVGLRTIQVESNGRTVPVDVWYPAPPGTTGAPARYTFLPEIYLDSEAAVAEAPLAADGPFPLVVYSHGSGGLRYISASATELLASHGFVVVAPDHVGNTAADVLLGSPTSFEQNAVNRTSDVTAVIDRILAEAATAGSPFEGAVDGEDIGLVGHSAGGATAFLTQTGVSVAEGTVPPEERIDALVLWAPATGRFTPEELAEIDVPVLYLGGTQDDVTPIDPNITVPWAAAPGRPAFRVDLTDAGHQSFTDVCRIQESFAQQPSIPPPLVDAVDGYAEDACVAGLMPIDRAHQLINRFTVSFFQSEVAGNERYGELLTADGDDHTVDAQL
jgi:predicted dienelactone hydrolase